MMFLMTRKEILLEAARRWRANSVHVRLEADPP